MRIKDEGWKHTRHARYLRLFGREEVRRSGKLFVSWYLICVVIVSMMYAECRRMRRRTATRKLI